MQKAAVFNKWKVEIDKSKCTGCGECVGSYPAVNMDECLGCETCMEVCEAEAITVTEA